MLKNKKLSLALASILTLSITLFGCGEKAKDMAKNAGDSVKNGADKAGEAAKKAGDAGMDLVKKITDPSMDYSKEDFKKDIDKKGYKLQKVEDSKSIFSVSNEDYTINGEKISIYEYEKNQKDKLEGDLNTVTENANTVNGAKMNWTIAPHIYKKGRIVVIYDGKNESVLTSLKEILGNPLL